MTQPLTSSFLRTQASTHLAANRGGRACVPDPGPIPLLAALLTVQLLPILINFFFLHRRQFIVKCPSFIFFIPEPLVHFDLKGLISISHLLPFLIHPVLQILNIHTHLRPETAHRPFYFFHRLEEPCHRRQELLIGIFCVIFLLWKKLTEFLSPSLFWAF